MDVSVPRNIDPDVRQVDNAFLFDIDDLESHIEQNREERRLEATRAESIVKDEVEVILKWLQSLKATPTIIALRQRADALKQAELQKALSRLGTLTPEQQEAVEGLASGIVNKLLHGPLVALKSAAQSSNGFVYIEAARLFYDLGQSLLEQQAVNVEDVRDETDVPAVPPASKEEPEQDGISRQASGL
ncbi:MAG: hypothetical protein F4224_02240 [Nitrospira sp. SB0678_bin_10]|nr:hypothetical protein [Nitrospira sp. SB0678_bin_10]